MDPKPAAEESKRDTGMFVLIWNDKDGNFDYCEKGSKKEILEVIEQIKTSGGHIVKFYIGAKERVVQTVVSYTF